MKPDEIQRTMYCANEACSSVGQVMFGGRWWCKLHAPEGAQELADMPALRAEVARLSVENAQLVNERDEWHMQSDYWRKLFAAKVGVITE